MSYERSASVYDAIYEDKKDYRRESEQLHDLIEQTRRSPGKTLLDVACGTGLHAQYLTQWYDVQGLDLSEAHLAIARRRLPAMTFHLADMADFDLGQRYDAVTCLFSAVGHLTTAVDLRRAVAAMARHLTPGGLLVIEPWLHPGDFEAGRVSTDFVEQPGLTVARVTQSALDGHLSKLTMHHFVDREGDVEHYVEHHDLAMYTPAEYLTAVRAAGLEARHEPEGLMGRGLFIGVKP